MNYVKLLFDWKKDWGNKKEEKYLSGGTGRACGFVGIIYKLYRECKKKASLKALDIIADVMEITVDMLLTGGQNRCRDNKKMKFGD